MRAVRPIEVHEFDLSGRPRDEFAGSALHGAQLLGHLGRQASIYLDRSDLLCWPALGIAYSIGRDELRRVPLGRPAAIHRLGRPASTALDDCRAAGGNHARIEDLADAIDDWDTARVDALLGA